MSGQGAYGVRGPTGPTGINGRKGHQGDGFGYTGPNLFAPGGLISFTGPPTQTPGPYELTVTPETSGTYYQVNISSVSGEGSIFNDTATLTLTSGGPFVVNNQLTGTGIYPGTYIVSVTSPTVYIIYPALSNAGSPTTITTVPSITLTLPTSGLVAGMFWVFNSAPSVSNKIVINLINGTAVYNGDPAATFIECAVGNSILLAYSGTAGSYIVF
jgi:hypothetical protein